MQNSKSIKNLLKQKTITQRCSIHVMGSISVSDQAECKSGFGPNYHDLITRPSVSRWRSVCYSHINGRNHIPGSNDQRRLTSPMRWKHPRHTLAPIKISSSAGTSTHSHLDLLLTFVLLILISKCVQVHPLNLRQERTIFTRRPTNYSSQTYASPSKIQINQ